MAGFFCAGFAAGFGLTLCIGGADQTRFNASLNGIAGVSFASLVSAFSFGVPMDKYHLALGRFIEAFADSEFWVLRVLWNAAKVDEATGKALFSGTRARGAIDFIGRVYESRDTELPADLARAFSQMNAINTMRDSIVHWGISIAGKALFDAQFVVSNENIAHAPRSKRAYPISPEIMEAMRADLRTILLILRVHLISQWEDSPIKDDLLRQQEPASRAQWRYKPPQPISMPDKKSRKRPPAPRGRHQPSQA